MNRHLKNELLSAYLDDEVSPAEAQSLENHLATCESCRVRLAGMRRTIHRIGAVERPAPPPWLAQRVRRHVLEAARPSLWMQLRQALLQLSLQSRLSSALSMTLTLAVLVFLLAHDVDRQEQQPEPEAVRALPAAGRPAPSDTAIVVLEEEILVTTSEVAGRTFVREEDGEIWVQAGLIGQEPESRVDVESPEGRALLARYQGIGDLLADGSRVVLLDDHREPLELWSGS